LIIESVKKIRNKHFNRHCNFVTISLIRHIGMQKNLCYKEYASKVSDKCTLIYHFYN